MLTKIVSREHLSRFHTKPNTHAHIHTNTHSQRKTHSASMDDWLSKYLRTLMTRLGHTQTHTLSQTHSHTLTHNNWLSFMQQTKFCIALTPLIKCRLGKNSCWTTGRRGDGRKECRRRGLCIFPVGCPYTDANIEQSGATRVVQQSRKSTCALAELRCASTVAVLMCGVVCVCCCARLCLAFN